ncbi:MAG TPA: OmpA family protein [Bryobacteraceae bacterium]|jgi:chemotaxis protein MotB|nr:OmpA family protein [Bryobacteraceae bacterium]
MIRKTGHSPVGVDRWMISWADLLTLLFASMVVLYASSARNRFKPPPPVPVVQAPPATPTPKVNELQAPFEQLLQSLAPELDAKELLVSLTSQGIVISLKDGAYFTSGSDDLEKSAIESIGKIAEVIRELPNPVRLEGHSDSLPIHTRRFHDNWSLSAARSIAVLTLLETRFEVPASRLTIAGYADNQPVSENESAEGRARNRRVDIVILGKTG